MHYISDSDNDLDESLRKSQTKMKRVLSFEEINDRVEDFISLFIKNSVLIKSSLLILRLLN
jgi:hypothetical protein